MSILEDTNEEGVIDSSVSKVEKLFIGQESLGDSKVTYSISIVDVVELDGDCCELRWCFA